MQKEITKRDLLNAFAGKTGCAHGQTARQLAVRLSCSKHLVGMLVQALRMDGIAVCGSPTNGYFIAATAEELEQTCRFLRDRAMTALITEAKLRRMPASSLVVQQVVPSLDRRPIGQ